MDELATGTMRSTKRLNRDSMKPLALVVEDEAAIAVTKEEAAALYAFARQGDVQGLLKQLDRYEHLSTSNHPFGARLRELARGYRMEQIRALIKPYLEREL